MSRIPAKLTLFLLLPVLSSTAASATIPLVELEALDQIYDVLQGADWLQDSGWKQGDPCAPGSAWFGVSCNDAGTNVVRLQLSGNRLAGDLGALTKFADLTKLGQLELGNNLGIPTDRWNHLRGNLPPGFATLTDLYYVDLRFNAISDRLDAFVSLGRLQQLALEENRFFGPIPPALGGLSELTLLTLNGNELTGPIPPQLGGLTKLTKLWLYNNALEGGVPAELGNLEQLIELRLGGNALSGQIPASLGRLRSLERLEMGLAFLDGELPPELADLSQLKALSLGTNRLSGELGGVDWSRLTRLTEVYLDTNLFSGPLPESLATLPTLRILRLQSNGFRSAVPQAYLDFLGRSGELDLRWNALDPTADAAQALDLRSNGEFSITQTVAPRSTSAVRRSGNSIFVTWAPIPFATGGGGYRIDVYGNAGADGTPIRSTIVAGKERSTALVNGVGEGSSLFVRLTSFTDPHPSNPGSVESASSAAVQVESDTGSGVARFERDRYVVREGDLLILNALRIDGSTGSLAATVSTRRGTASDDDFSNPRPASLLWASGDTALRQVSLATAGDGRQEPTETLEIALSVGTSESRSTVEIGDRVVAGSAADPVIATNAQGLSFAAWTQTQANSAQRDVFGRFLDAAGRALGGVIEIAADAALDEHDPEVVALEDDSFIVAWIQNRRDGGDRRMGSCRPTSTEAKCTRTVRTSPWFAVSGITLAADGSSYWLGWTTPNGFFVQRGATPGGSPADAVLVASPPAGSSHVFVEPHLVRLSANRLMAVWTSVLEAAEAIEPGGEIQAQAFTPDGGPIGELRRFGGSAAAAQRGPRAVRVSDAAAFIVWEETSKSSQEGLPQIAWSQVSVEDPGSLGIERLALLGGAIGQLAVLRQDGACQIVWLSTSAAGERFERRVVPACSAGSESRPVLVVDALEGRRESFAVTSTSRGLLFVQELVATRGVRWLKSARPPSL